MANPFLGQLKLVPYNFAPEGWAFCQGQLLSILDNSALFNLIGTTFGGDGQTTFALPDLQGRVPLHMGNSYVLGEVSGSEQVTLEVSAIPAHSHEFFVSNQLGNSSNPAGNYAAEAPLALGYVYDGQQPILQPMNQVGETGSSVPHENRQPTVVLNYIIALQGIYPSQG